MNSFENDVMCLHWFARTAKALRVKYWRLTWADMQCSFMGQVK
jgi:hypothetical protein